VTKYNRCDLPPVITERSEAALLRRPEPQAEELVAPRPFTEFTLSAAEGLRAAAGGRLRGAISGVAYELERSIASRRSFPFGCAQGCGSLAECAQNDSKGKLPPLQLKPLAERVTLILETERQTERRNRSSKLSKVKN
jgi:hypothetical protein